MGEADEGETSLKKGAKLVFKDWKVCFAFPRSFAISTDTRMKSIDLDAHLPADVHFLLPKLHLLLSRSS